MSTVLFLIWYMVAILPMLIFMEGFHWFQKFMAKRGYDFTGLHFLILVLTIIVIILYAKGYR